MAFTDMKNPEDESSTKAVLFHIKGLHSPESSFQSWSRPDAQGQEWLKLPAACPLGTWSRVWAQLQQGCGAPHFSLISAIPSRSHII